MRSIYTHFAVAAFIAMGLGLLPAYSQTASPADCCGDAAQQKLAASLGFVDVVGVKLGMSPKEAVAAIKAHDPNLKIETLTVRLEDPSGPAGNFTRVPYSMNAHSINHDPLKGPVEYIAMQFTTPPNHPVVAKIVRYTAFTAGQPVQASNLLDALRKKYGQDNYVPVGSHRAWVYDSAGKLLTNVSGPQGGCVSDAIASSIAGAGPTDHDPARDVSNINLDNTNEATGSAETKAACVPIVFVAAFGVGPSYAPNSPQLRMEVTLESGALIHDSRKATHDWLQAKADRLKKQSDDAAKQRTGPKLGRSESCES